MDINKFKLLEDSVDIDNASIYFSGPIESDFLFLLRTRIEMLKIYNKERSNSSFTIKLFIDSIGGDLISTFCAIEYFERLKKDNVLLDIIAEGRCYSSALVLLLGATGKRFAVPSTIFMYHKFTNYLPAKELNDFISLKFEKTLKNCDIKTIEFTEKDYYFGISDALKYNVINNIFV